VEPSGFGDVLEVFVPGNQAVAAGQRDACSKDIRRSFDSTQTQQLRTNLGGSFCCGQVQSGNLESGDVTTESSRLGL